MYGKKRPGHLGGDETFWIWLDVPSACADFCDPTAVARIIVLLFPDNIPGMQKTYLKKLHQ